jgi:hypothetical protein
MSEDLWRLSRLVAWGESGGRVQVPCLSEQQAIVVRVLKKKKVFYQLERYICDKLVM